MLLALLTFGIASLELASLRFGADTREPGDWHRVEFERIPS